MEKDQIVRMITEKCDIFYDDALISSENIMKQYLHFFADHINPEEKSVNFSFHTGSVCFDIVSVAAAIIGCLAFEFSSNEEILAELNLGDLVLYKKKRYHWLGIEKKKWGLEEQEYIVLKQDGKGKNGPSTDWILYEKNKHLIKPYYGGSTKTDGRGIRKETGARTDFLSYILDIPQGEVPVSLDVSVVVIADKNEFIDICKHLKFRYKQENYVEVTDIIPVSYYTNSGEQFQIGRNQSKAEAVIKVTGSASVARDLVLDKSGNSVIGILILNFRSHSADVSELNDIFRRKSLKFAYYVAPFNNESCDYAMEQYETANIFASTKEQLSSLNHDVIVRNKLTDELHQQINNVIFKSITTTEIDLDFPWEKYKDLKSKIYAVKHSNWTGEERDSFLLSSLALLNLFSTSFFSMSVMESAIKEGSINSAVVSPEKRLSELQNIVIENDILKEQCSSIVAGLIDFYTLIFDSSPKEEMLRKIISDNPGKKIAIVVSKAYHVDIFNRMSLCENDNSDIVCVTANRFDYLQEYDLIVVVGDIIGKRFDALQCFSSSKIQMLLYGFESKVFSHRKKKSEKTERKINAKIKGLSAEEYRAAIETDESDDIQEETIREFSDLDDFVNSIGMFDIRRFASIGAGNGAYNTTSEVKYVGAFTTGEKILFSKFYSAVVFDQNNEEITEKSPEKLLPGDILVFTKKTDYTKNIVDQIFDQLISEKKLTSDVQDAAEKAYYWKEILREYKEKHDLTYRSIAKELKMLGSNLQEVTIRQWLMEESHIVGPQKVEAMKAVANLTRDPYLLSDPQGYFEACGIVRHYRREILSLIAKAINDKLSNKEPTPGSAFEVVFENVEKLSETMELENIYELDVTANVINSMVNRPISENEVLL